MRKVWRWKLIIHVAAQTWWLTKMADEGKENPADPQVHPALETKVILGNYKKLYLFPLKRTL